MNEATSIAPPTGRRRILVVGCGYVGGALARRLAADGHAVWGVRRSPGPPAAGVRTLTADVTRPPTLAGLPEGMDDVVVLLATGAGGQADYHGLYVDGLAHLLDALRTRSPALRRLIFVSSTGVYGDCGGAWVDEESPVHPAIDAGRALAAAETLLREGPFPSLIVRFSGIYGPNRIRLIRTVQSGRATYAPGPPRYLNQIHRDDCVGVLRHLLALPSPAPLYLATDHEPATRQEVLTWIATRLDGPPPIEKEDGAAPGSRRGSKRCSNRRLVESGYRFRFPTFRDGYGALLKAGPRSA